MISTFLSMLEKGNDNSLVRYSLGNAYFGEKNYQEAIKHLRKAVEHDSNYSAAWKILGKSLFELELYDKALEVYNSGIEVACAQGDKQAEKEMLVFKRRCERALDKG